MHRLATVALVSAAALLPGADWGTPGVVRRWALEPDGKPTRDPVGRVLVWPQSDAETAALVTAADGRAVGSRVLWARPGEPIEVWFDAAAAGEHPLVWVGAGLQAPAWEPAAGLVLEIRTRPDLPFDTADQIMALWDKAAPVQGRCGVERIFHGANPFGPSTELVARFTGSFTVPAAGAWRFATISDDGSVLAIDGRRVADWPGGHGPEEGLRGEHNGLVQLTAGRHRIDYLVVQSVGGFTAEVAWRAPTAATWEVMPASAFAGAAPWRAVRPETAQGPDLAAATWAVTAHAAPGTEESDPCLIEMRFEAVGPPGVAAWRFDDGSGDDGRLVRHWWLAGGLRRATVEVRPEKGAPAVRTVAVAVHPDWEQPGPMPDERANHWRKALESRALAKGPPGEIAAAARIALAAGETSVLLRLAEIAAGRARDLAGADAGTALDLALRLQGAELRRYRDSAVLLQAIAEAGQPALAAARARLHLGGLRLHVDGDAAGAAAAWQGLVPSALGDTERRLLALYRADALLLSGDEAAARAAYRAVGTVVDPSDRRWVMRRRLRLELARDRLSQGHWDQAESALREIEWETPLERLGTETGLLLMRLWLSRGELERARVRGRMLLACEDGPRTPDVLLLAARTELAAKAAPAAAALIARLRRDHPFSEAAAAARDLMPESKP